MYSFQLGEDGFICLLNSNNTHYEVLTGVDGGQPVIPLRAQWQNVDQNIDDPFKNLDDIRQRLDYPFARRWSWPGGRPSPVMAYHRDIVQVVNVNVERAQMGQSVQVELTPSESERIAGRMIG